MTFQAPSYSSSPPSTPDRRSNNGNNNSYFFGENPSTTPAGPPPSSTGSFTPMGPPPSSFLGSSMMSTTSPIKPVSRLPLSYSKPNSFSITSSPAASFMQSHTEQRRSGLSHEYQASSQGAFQAPEDSDDEEEDDDYRDDEEDQEEDEEYEQNSQSEGDDRERMSEEEASNEDDEEMDDYESETSRSRGNEHTYNQSTRSELLFSQQGSLLQSREGDIPNSKDSMGDSRVHVSMFQRVAKELYSRMPVPPVDESDDLILETEATVRRLYDDSFGNTDDEAFLQEALSTIPSELARLWDDYHRRTAVHDSEEYMATIGPSLREPNFVKANFLAGLTLRIHHPESVHSSFMTREKPLPEILLEWMDEHHNPYGSQLEEIVAHKPSPANHQLFWDTIYNCLLRGKVIAVVNLMKDAGWRYARNETDNPRDETDQFGFSGVALRNVERVTNAATQVLSQCPATNGDWNTRGREWTLFRLRISQALEDLKSFAEGRGRDRENLRDSIAEPGSFSRAAKKATSQVPWALYQNLVALYTLVMGDATTIIMNSQDWCEATVGLVVWWDDGKDDKRVALGQSQRFRHSTSISDIEAYQRKLRKSFELAIADSTDFQVNSMSEIEVGLASLFEGDNEAVIGILRGWSGPVSSAVAEVASLAGWLPQAEEKSLINLGGLDDEDMDVLGFNSSPSKTDGAKDKTLITYARSLSQRGELRSTTRPGPARESWELAIALLGRLDSVERSEEMIGEFLNQFRLDSSITVDKLWRLLNEVGMSRHAENIAESYADSLAEGSYKYGTALWYYALAHKNQKVKDVLDLLISFSLIQSTAYPPEPELDDHLKALIFSPKDTLTELSRMDLQAAELIHKMLSGYATLRKFYSLRDEEVQLSAGNNPKLGARARKSQAATALVAVIASSDDNIRGGLYDEERGAVVSVDFLLALLGEAMVFINQPDFSISVSQIEVLLKAIEDLQTLGPRIYSACTEFLQTVVASGQGLKGSTPTDMLRKSTSNISGSSFSMVGSSMLASQLKQSMSSSGVLVKGNVKRGWDWRRTISAGTTGEDVLRILRYGLAKDLAKAWLIEADNKM